MNIIAKLALVFFLIFSVSACNFEESKINNDKTEFKELKNKELQELNLLKDKVNLLMPSDFKEMSKEMIAKRYPPSSPPSLVYSNESGEINIALKHTNNFVTTEKLPSLLSVFVKQFSNAFKDIRWKERKIANINDNEFIILEFETHTLQNQIYNLMALSSLENKLMTISFNCPVKEKGAWKEQANEIINSIKFKK